MPMLSRRIAQMMRTSFLLLLLGFFSSTEAKLLLFKKNRSKKNSAPPCACEAANPAWVPPPAQRPGQCFFFDLGAGDGETYLAFLNRSQKWQFAYDTGAFPKEQCTSFLLEANPKFGPQLNAPSITQFAPGKVVPMVQQAVYMCDKPEELFYLDTSDPGAWGSALDTQHASVKGTAAQQAANAAAAPAAAGTSTAGGAAPAAVKVQLVNLMRLLKQTVTKQDTVVVKMDIEGAEWDILPCLASNPEIAGLVDTLYLENHCPSGSSEGGAWCASTGQAGNTKAHWDAAVASLQASGVQMPAYFSPMMLL